MNIPIALQILNIKRLIELSGASWFVGIVILQRLLRVKNAEKSQIFCSLRLSSKHASVKQRLRNEILGNEIMELSKTEIDKIVNNERVIAIQSDLTHDLLGFNEQTMTQLQNSSSQENRKGIVVIHCAADVIFDREFNESININANGTYQCIQVARKLNAAAFIYISTMYVNSTQTSDATIAEKIYVSNMNEIFAKWVRLKQNNSVLSKTEIKSIKNKCCSKTKWPNNYTFTKNMAENIVRHYCNLCNINSSIVRLGIVSPMHEGNNKGWFIGKGGFVFFVIALATGNLRYLSGDGKGRPNFVPVDYCADSILAISGETIVDNECKSKVYQCSVINHDSEWNVTNCMDYIWPRFYNHKHEGLGDFIKNKRKPKYHFIQNRILFFMVKLFFFIVPLYLLIGVELVLNVFTQVFRISAIQSLLKSIKFMKFAIKKFIWFDKHYSLFVNARWNFINRNVADLFQLLDKESKEKYNINPSGININVCAFEAAEINFIKYLNYKKNQKGS